MDTDTLSEDVPFAGPGNPETDRERDARHRAELTSLLDDAAALTRARERHRLEWLTDPTAETLQRRQSERALFHVALRTRGGLVDAEGEVALRPRRPRRPRAPRGNEPVQGVAAPHRRSAR